jgi:TLD
MRENSITSITSGQTRMVLVSVQSNNYWLFFFLPKKNHKKLIKKSPHPGLHVDKSLVKGSSHNCKTYDNDKLTNKNHFGIKNLEIWGLGLAYRNTIFDRAF